MSDKNKAEEKQQPRIVQITAFYDPEAKGEVIYGLDADGKVWLYGWGKWERA